MDSYGALDGRADRGCTPTHLITWSGGLHLQASIHLTEVEIRGHRVNQELHCARPDIPDSVRHTPTHTHKEIDTMQIYRKCQV